MPVAFRKDSLCERITADASVACAVPAVMDEHTACSTDGPRRHILADEKAPLVSGKSDGRWHYDEGCVTAAWKHIG